MDPDIPMLGFIGRLDYQKGVDLIRDTYGFFMEQNCQLVMLGSGREDLENNLRCVGEHVGGECVCCGKLLW